MANPELHRIIQLEKELGADVAVELIDLFICDGPEQLSAMRDALGRADSEQLKRAAHSLKGSCGNLGLRALSDAAAALERFAIDNGCADAESRVADLERLFEQIKSDLQALRQQLAQNL